MQGHTPWKTRSATVLTKLTKLEGCLTNSLVQCGLTQAKENKSKGAERHYL